MSWFILEIFHVNRVSWLPLSISVCRILKNDGFWLKSSLWQKFVKTGTGKNIGFPEHCAKVTNRHCNHEISPEWIKTRTTDAQWSLFFHRKPRLLGLGRQIGQIHFSAFGVFSADLSAPILVLWVPCPCFFIILQKTKPSCPSPKHLIGIWIWIWAAKNKRFSHRVSVVCESDQSLFFKRLKKSNLYTCLSLVGHWFGRV